MINMLDLNVELEKIKERLFAQRIQRDPFYRLALTGYQYGYLQKCVVYTEYYGEKGFKSEIKLQVADLCTQALLLAMLFGLDPEDTLRLGLDRIKEFCDKRMREKNECK